MEKFGEVLGKFRSQKGLTQDDLSTAVRLIEALDLNDEEIHQFAHEVFGIPTLFPDLKDPLLNELLDLIKSKNRDLLWGLLIGIRSMDRASGGDAAAIGPAKEGFG